MSGRHWERGEEEREAEKGWRERERDAEVSG